LIVTIICNNKQVKTTDTSNILGHLYLLPKSIIMLWRGGVPLMNVRGSWVMPELWWLVASFSPWRPRAANVGFAVDKVALGWALLRVFWISPVNITAPLLHIHSCIIWGLDSGLLAATVP
jgi:hypothetical protein